MIFFIGAGIISLGAVYLLAGAWENLWMRLLFALVSALMAAMLVLFGLEFKISTTRPEAERRIIVCAVDVSASAALKPDRVREYLEDEFPGYNLELIPFSRGLHGPEMAESTALIDSIQELQSYVSSEYEDDKVAGLVILSDGNETEKLDGLNGTVPVTGSFAHNVLYLKGAGKGVRFDKSVLFTDVPRFMPRYKKEKIRFAVTVRGASLKGVPVELRLDGKNIGSVLVNIENGYGSGEFDLVIKEAGNFLLSAAVALDSRETLVSNNKDYAPVEGIMKGFRVLHISGHPSADTAFIRRGLQNIPGVDMISFYILRTHKQLLNTPNAELSLIPFPTDQLFRSELDNFDLIIMNDFSLTEFLSPYYINNIAKFVRTGGGLLIMGGPNSYMSKDYVFNSFGSIVPCIPTNGTNWSGSERYRVIPEDISHLISLKGLLELKGTAFVGLNRVQLKEQANLFVRASNGSPLIAGISAGKGRVLAVMTDSFWKASYNTGISNEEVLKSFARYLLGISSMPVTVRNETIDFDPVPGLKEVSAELGFINPNGTVIHRSVITPGSPYTVKKNDSRIINVTVYNNRQNAKRPVDSYKLVNFNEKKDNEFTFVPLGKEFLERFANAGGGEFVLTTADTIKDSLEEIDLRKPVLVSRKKKVSLPLYRHAGILVLFIYSVLCSFYLKSRFYG
ncbi:MAG: hypothetical protein GY754_21545 [bacterium]|nr:hypothetical protein [bacterium]